MNRLLVPLLLAVALVLMPATAVAQEDDEDTSSVVVVTEGEELPAATENPPDAVDSTDTLDTMTSLEYWHLAAFALPALIGRIVNRLPKRWQTASHSAHVSLVVYFSYGGLGELLKGSFDTLTWDTPQLVTASIVKVATISYTGYKILGNAAPSLVGGKPGPTA